VLKVFYLMRKREFLSYMQFRNCSTRDCHATEILLALGYG